MPTYVYACKSCGHTFEQHQSFSDDALTTCPECGQETLRKVFNSVGVVFKGSGFYKTDSRSGTSATSTAADSTSAGSSTASEASSPPSGAGETSTAPSTSSTTVASTSTPASSPGA